MPQNGRFPASFPSNNAKRVPRIGKKKEKRKASLGALQAKARLHHQVQPKATHRTAMGGKMVCVCVCVCLELHFDRGWCPKKTTVCAWVQRSVHTDRDETTHVGDPLSPKWKRRTVWRYTFSKLSMEQGRPFCARMLAIV